MRGGVCRPFDGLGVLVGESKRHLGKIERDGAHLKVRPNVLAGILAWIGDWRRSDSSTEPRMRGKERGYFSMGAPTMLPHSVQEPS